MGLNNYLNKSPTKISVHFIQSLPEITHSFSKLFSFLESIQSLEQKRSDIKSNLLKYTNNLEIPEEQSFKKNSINKIVWNKKYFPGKINPNNLTEEYEKRLLFFSSTLNSFSEKNVLNQAKEDLMERSL